MNGTPAHEQPCSACGKPIGNCGRRGYCGRHYTHVRRYGRPLTDDEIREIRVEAGRRNTSGFHSPEGRAEAAASARRRNDERIEELEFLLERGVGVELALERLDWSPSAAEKAAVRRGRADLARQIYPIVTRQRAEREAS